MIFSYHWFEKQYEMFLHQKTGLFLKPVFYPIENETLYNFFFYIPVSKEHENHCILIFGNSYWQFAAFRQFVYALTEFEDYECVYEQGYITIKQEREIYEY